MHWIVAAPFLHEQDQQWLIPFVKKNHSFEIVLARYHHDRSRENTSSTQWKDYLAHGNLAYQAALMSNRPVGIITAFPQLAITVGIRKKIALKKIPIVASVFNLGQIYGGIKGKLARFGLNDVDTFIVHSTKEIEVYSQWLKLPNNRFNFMPLQRPMSDSVQDEDDNSPFVLAMGSANRDYALFLSVMGTLGYPTIVVAGEHALAGLVIPHNVTVMSNLSISQCHSLVQRARVNVVPIDNCSTASGQVTLIDAMMFGKAVVATRTAGTVDYVNDNVSAQLVAPNDVNDLANAVQSLWTNKHKRDKMGEEARKFVIENLSDQAAGESLSRLLDQVEKTQKS